jgi:CheY-like chemotaxis protein
MADLPGGESGLLVQRLCNALALSFTIGLRTQLASEEFSEEKRLSASHRDTRRSTESSRSKLPSPTYGDSSTSSSLGPPGFGRIQRRRPLALCRRSHPDLLIADLPMQEVDGYELVRCVRTEERTGNSRRSSRISNGGWHTEKWVCTEYQNSALAARANVAWPAAWTTISASR